MNIEKEEEGDALNYHDMLTRLGLGSAHPGGYNATLDCLDLLNDLGQQHILEIGCGTGRTATALAKLGHKVTALDIREGMILKAKQRARHENVSINWVIGDACSLPFDDHSFDSIIIESVTVFVNIKKALPEYFRVLKNNGSIYDREMMALEQLSVELRNQIFELYGAKYVPSANQWQELYRMAGFNDVSIYNRIQISEELMRHSTEIPDPYQIVDEDLFHDPSFFEISISNSVLMQETAPYLEHGIIIAKK